MRGAARKGGPYRDKQSYGRLRFTAGFHDRPENGHQVNRFDPSPDTRSGQLWHILTFHTARMALR